ncbi:hypothetical protein F5I97DRAFT_1785750, partial [Phlebopus sp. FC_14]
RHFSAEELNLNHSVEHEARHLDHIRGRWQAVRSSLGLPPRLSTAFSVDTSTIRTTQILGRQYDKPALRFDSRRGRAHSSRQPVPLYLAEDARNDVPTQSLEDIAAVFRQIAAAEKE